MAKSLLKKAKKAAKKVKKEVKKEVKDASSSVKSKVSDIRAHVEGLKDSRRDCAVIDRLLVDTEKYKTTIHNLSQSLKQISNFNQIESLLFGRLESPLHIKKV